MKIENYQQPTMFQFLNLVAQLRNPEGGCPWDLAQNFDTMLPHLLEETYEVAEAIHTQDRTALREELGDLLLQVVFLSQLAKEEGSFDFNDVLTDIHNKLIYPLQSKPLKIYIYLHKNRFYKVKGL